ncbi:MAG: hypothetical protein H8F28_23865 [Fibrella sp.]|nr:hypothetical protein [Armatimonadota bacterium]
MKHSFIFPARFASAIALASLSVLSIVGCGGGDDDPNAGLPLVASPNTSLFAGRKTGTIALSGDKTGALDFTVDAANRAAGTITIAGSSRQAYGFTVGTFNISGTVDPITGAFTMTGDIPGSGPFSVGGTLPDTSGVGGGYTLTAAGETYTGVFGGIAAPSPSPGATPTPTPTPVAGGAVSFQVVSKSADCNVTESKLNNFSVESARFAGSGAFYSTTVSLQSGDANFTLNWVRLNDADGLTPETLLIPTEPQIGTFGDPFQVALSGLQMPAGVGVSFGGVTLPGAGLWRPSAGTFVVESVTGKSMVVRGENVVFKPVPAPTNSGTGEFTANFRITVDSVDGL